MKKALVLEKVAGRKLVNQIVNDQAAYAVGRVLTEGRVKGGWRAFASPVQHSVTDLTVETGKLNEDGTPKTQHKTEAYSFELHLQQKSKRLRREDVIEEEFSKIVDLVTKALKSKGWVVKEVKDLPEDYVLPGYENADVEVEPEVEVETEAEEKVEATPEVEVEVSPEPAAG